MSKRRLRGLKAVMPTMMNKRPSKKKLKSASILRQKQRARYIRATVEPAQRLADWLDKKEGDPMRGKSVIIKMLTGELVTRLVWAVGQRVIYVTDQKNYDLLGNYILYSPFTNFFTFS